MIGKLKSAKEIFKNSNGEFSYDVDFVNYVMEHENKEIIIFKDNPTYFSTKDDFTFIESDFEYIKENSSKVKPIGYEYNGYKLGQTVIFDGKKENIVGFDEDCKNYLSSILITDSTNRGNTFMCNKAMLTSCLDTSSEQATLWISSNDIEKEETPRVDIEENEHKLPKYIKIIDCSSINYWYKDYIGRAFKVINYDNYSNDYEVKISKDDYGDISLEDCQPIKKKELMIVGSKVKLKKKYYDEILDKNELHNFKDKVITIKNAYEDEYGKWFDFEENELEGWEQYMFKPYLGD